MLWRYDEEQRGVLKHYIFEQKFVDTINPDEEADPVQLDKSVRVHDVYLTELTDLQEGTYIFSMIAYRDTSRDPRSLSDNFFPRLPSKTRPTPYSSLLAQTDEGADLQVTAAADTIPGKQRSQLIFRDCDFDDLYKHHEYCYCMINYFISVISLFISFC